MSMSETRPCYRPEDRPAMMQEALNGIGSWMLGAARVEPGWDELTLDIKPLSDAIFVRITESRDGQDYVGSTGPVKQDSPVVADIEKLQHAAFVEGQGSWFTASVVVIATGWPSPQYQIGASYDYSHEPQDWGGEGGLTGRDIRSHLKTFPRSEGQLPQWAATRLAGRRGLGMADAPAASGVDGVNPYLNSALQTFAAQRSEAALANVVRSCEGGNVVMDISQSTTSDNGALQVRYQVLNLTNGLKALTAYSSPEQAKNAAARLGGGDLRLQVEPAMKVFLQVVHDEAIDVLVLDPQTPQECFIEKAQLQWAVSTPHNEPAKRALVEGDMRSLLTALGAPASVLLMGVRQGDTAGRPVVMRNDGAEEGKTALVFTSATEIAALDPSLEVRTAPAMEVLKLLAAGDADRVRINALNPHATLPMQQVRELISILESQ